MSTGLFSIGPRAVAQLGDAPKASGQLPEGITRHLASDRSSLISEKRSRKSAARSLPFILGRVHHVFPFAFLKYFRQFYLAFPAQSVSEIGHTLCDQLTWSHYRLVMRVEKPGARAGYPTKRSGKMALRQFCSSLLQKSPRWNCSSGF